MTEPSRGNGEVRRPLCTDLDGTLIATDLLWESLLSLVRTRPLLIFLLPFWLLQGKARFKRLVAQHAPLEVAHLPYRDEVVSFVRIAQEQRRRVVLVTAADALLAEQAARHLGIPETVASDGKINLKGARKLEAIRDRLGDEPFDYIGDGPADIPVLEAARTAYLAGPDRGRLNNRLGGRAQPLNPLSPPPSFGRSCSRACRPHQWSKNMLLFVPALVGHRFGDLGLWLHLITAFFSISFMASAVYILNDLLDLSSDRCHPHKKNRPFASGDLPIPAGMVLFFILVTASLLISLAILPRLFTWLLLLYAVLTTLYSLSFKRKLMVDVLVLAGLYTLRVLAGGYPFGIELTFWLLSFSMFLFLSLAFAKRYSELLSLLGRDGTQPAGRGYSTADLDMIRSFGPVTGCLAVLVFALYINSDAVLALYARPQILWLVCPVLLYWISRVWFIAHRGQLPEDPVLFALHDGRSYLSAILILALTLLATVRFGE